MPLHPRLDHGRKVQIHKPSLPSPMAAWADPAQVAAVVPDGPMPPMLNGVPFRPWTEVPVGTRAWEARDLSEDGMAPDEEPPFDARGLPAAAGAVVLEPDGRVWLVAPTNAYGGAETTFPKGHAGRLDLRTTAVKEVYEEAGLHIRLVGHLVDVTRSTTRTRYYLARRKGGTPAAMGWESQAVLLAPVADLKGLLARAVDRRVVAALLAHLDGRQGPAPLELGAP